MTGKPERQIDFVKLADRPRWWRRLFLRLFAPMPVRINGGELNPCGFYHAFIPTKGLWVGQLTWFEGTWAAAARDRTEASLRAEIERLKLELAALNPQEDKSDAE